MFGDSELEQLRFDFPVLSQEVNGHPLVYFDNAATSQRPKSVIEAMDHFYLHDNANVHRGIHALSERATYGYESARSKIQHFIGAKHAKEIIFTRGTTEAINLVAQSYARTHLVAGDEILISCMEHHANIVPWQMVCEQTGALLKVIPINHAGELLLDDIDSLINPRTKLLAITHVSNTLGTINDIAPLIRRAHQVGAKVLIDGAQAVPHMAVDVQALDCDFYCFSGHKIYGPTGIGVLYGKAELLQQMPPFQGGGNMIKTVSFAKTTYQDIPHKFEAGTPAIAEVIGLGAALDYVTKVGLTNIAAQEHVLLVYATAQMLTVPGLTLIGTAANKASIISFIMDGIHPHDISTILDTYGIAIRAGHHCTMPLMAFYQVAATARASFAFYNTFAEVDKLVFALKQAREIFH